MNTGTVTLARPTVNLRSRARGVVRVLSRESAGLLAAFNWDVVVVALITAVGTCVNTAIGVVLYWHLRTPSGMTIGKQVESAHHVALGNNYRLQSLTGELNVNVPADANVEESRRRPPDVRV